MKVQGVASRPSPEYVKLDYWNKDDWARYMLDKHDNVPATTTGIRLDPPIRTSQLKLRLVLPSNMPSDQHACMRFELFTCDEKNSPAGPQALVPALPANPRKFLKNGIPLEFAIVDNQVG